MNYASPRFDELEAGQELPPLVKTPSEVQLFMFSAITWDTHRTHFDTPYSVDEESLPGILVHGHLQGAFLSHGPSSRSTPPTGPARRGGCVCWTIRTEAW